MKLQRLCFYRCLSDNRGVSASVHTGIPPPGSRHPQADTPQSRQPPWEQTTPPGADTPLGADTPWSRPPRSDIPPGSDTPEEQTPPRSRHPPGQTPPIFFLFFASFYIFFAFFAFFYTPRYSTGDGYCCGRHASYLNVFLFLIIFSTEIVNKFEQLSFKRQTKFWLKSSASHLKVLSHLSDSTHREVISRVQEYRFDFSLIEIC